MKITCSSGFTIPIIETYIEQDTSELLSCQNYTSSRNQLEDDPDADYKNLRVLETYPRIKNILTDAFNDVAFNTLNCKNKFIMTTSWITNTGVGEKSHIHNHKNSFYSGVYFFDKTYDENIGNLCFENPVNDFTSFVVNFYAFHPLNSGLTKIMPEPKKLILFPSYLRHFVEINRSKKNRKSLAFNFVPVGQYGSGDSFMDLSWTKEFSNHIKYS
jgi:uncharacterized protein (TIGR02466 family)